MRTGTLGAMVNDQPDQPDQPDQADDPGAVAVPAGDRPLDPEKLLRLAGLVKAVLDEVRQFDQEQATGPELAGLHRRVTAQIDDALPNVLREELAAIDLGVNPSEQTTSQDVRVAYAGLIGWLGGLFQGLQASIQAQQIQSLQALQRGEAGLGGEQPGPENPSDRHSGMYL